jgi:hypothetical protein
MKSKIAHKNNSFRTLTQQIRKKNNCKFENLRKMRDSQAIDYDY